VARYFGYPPESFFFTNEEGYIYMNNMNVKDTLFPMKTAKSSTYLPTVKVCLKKSMDTLDFMIGD